MVRRWLAILAMSVGFLGCSDSGLPELEPGLATKFACPCAAGFECDPVEKVCVAKGVLAGDAADGMGAGDGGSDAGDGSAAEIDAATGEVVGSETDDIDGVVGDLSDNADAPDSADSDAILPDISDIADVGESETDSADGELDSSDSDVQASGVDGDTADLDTEDDGPVDADAAPEVLVCDKASPDSDGDGEPDCVEQAAGCPEGATADKAIWSGAAELCDGKDNDCDSQTDEGCDDDKDNYCDAGMKVYGLPAVCKLTKVGKDGDAGDDCNDGSASISPGGAEVCANGVDDNCNGSQDEGSGTSCQSFFADGDGDGYGLGAAKCLCSSDAVFKAIKAGDCDDGKALVFPGAKELCGNAVDDNCSGGTDEGCGSVEVCNDKDDNLDGKTDEGCDQDKDGYCTSGLAVVGKPAACLKGGGDCDDDPAKNKDAGLINPGAPELCDGMDNNCGAGTDEIFKYSEPSGESLGVGQGCGLGACSAAGAKVVCGQDKISANCPGYQPQTETCDNADNDCDGQTDEGFTWSEAKLALGAACDGPDGDLCANGLVACTTDHKSANCGTETKEDVKEICDEIDNDCDGITDEEHLYQSKPLKATCIGVGACGPGKVICSPKTFLATCSSNPDAFLILYGAELCDGLDNDCNGKTDDNLSFNGYKLGATCPAVGICAAGTVECGGDKQVICSTQKGGSKYQGKVEVCNGQDDDCNGVTDDSCACPDQTVAIDIDGKTVCAPDHPGVWGIRPLSPPSAWFTDNGNGTVSDSNSKLMWQKGDSGTEKKWTDAKAYCQQLVLGGKSDWRWPTRFELETLIDFAKLNQAVPSVFAATTASEWYWSASPYQGSASAAWNVSFSNGGSYYFDITNSNRVRCVR